MGEIKGGDSREYPKKPILPIAGRGWVFFEKDREAL